MSMIAEPVQTAHEPFGYSEIERRGDGPFCTLQPGRGSRQQSLEAVRYATLTLHDIIAAIQSDWPPDRPQSQKVQDAISFGAFAIARLRNGELRRLAADCA